VNRSELIHFAMWHARCEILRHADRESCIVSSRILCDVYAELGIRSMPLVVDVVIFNQAAFEANLRGENPNPEDEDSGQYAMRCEVVPGGSMDDQWWKGHLLVLADGRFICDVSADQFARPQHGIDATPSTIEFPTAERLEAWLDGDMDGRATIHLPGEQGIIAYEAHAEELSYRDCSDWEDTVRGDRLRDRVLENVIGLCDLYADVDLPPLPDLPPSRSAKDPDTPERVEAMIKSVVDLGYTPEDMIQRVKDEAVRERERKARVLEKRISDLSR
jgi:hypothetical protein